jgi:hypothetical protein
MSVLAVTGVVIDVLSSNINTPVSSKASDAHCYMPKTMPAVGEENMNY